MTSTLWSRGGLLVCLLALPSTGFSQEFGADGAYLFRWETEQPTSEVAYAAPGNTAGTEALEQLFSSDVPLKAASGDRFPAYQAVRRNEPGFVSFSTEQPLALIRKMNELYQKTYGQFAFYDPNDPKLSIRLLARDLYDDEAWSEDAASYEDLNAYERALKAANGLGAGATYLSLARLSQGLWRPGHGPNAVTATPALDEDPVRSYLEERVRRLEVENVELKEKLVALGKAADEKIAELNQLNSALTFAVTDNACEVRAFNASNAR